MTSGEEQEPPTFQQRDYRNLDNSAGTLPEADHVERNPPLRVSLNAFCILEAFFS